MVNLNRMRFLIGYEQRLRFDRLKKFARATKITTILTGMPRGSGTGNQTAKRSSRNASGRSQESRTTDTRQ